MRWLEDRHEHFLCSAHSRDQLHEVEIGFDDDGHILALRDDFIVDCGAWNPIGAGVPYNTAAHLTGPYKIDHLAVSARTGEGVDALVEALAGRLPEGPAWYPDDMVTDVPEAFWVAELVREQLLARVREEVPHSIATRVTEWEWPRIRCEILVERESQKGIVIGKGGAVLKEVGTRVREQLEEGAYVELFVKVDKDWQRRPKALNRLGY